jgi:peptidyl-prolyl cis-trans isomerase D
MLDKLRRGRRWGTAAIVLLVGGVFVLFIGLGGPLEGGDTSAVIDVAGQAYYRDDFYRAYKRQEQNLQEMAGDAFDPSKSQEFLKASTASQLVNQAILASAAGEMGIGVSKGELRQIVRSDPGFQGPTGFDQEQYEGWVQYEYGTEGHFLRSMERQILALKLARLVGSAAYVSDAEALDAARYKSQEARLAFVALETSIGDPEALSEEEVQAFADANPERLQQTYDARRSEYEQREAIRARHILVRAAGDAEEAELEEARGRAEAVLQRIRDGAAFEDVALEVSEDPGSQAQGGDLGFFSRGTMTPAFEEAAFGLEPGVVSELVRSDFGFHIIRVEERREGGTRTLDDVRLELARELLAAERASSDARENADALSASIQEGRSLEEAARARGLTVERTDWLRRREDGFLPGLGASLPVQDTAFTLPAETSSPRIFEVEGKLTLVQTLERREPDAEALAARADVERSELLERERGQLLDAWVDAERRRLELEGRLWVNLAALDEF